jgi:hypothetical protein
MNAKLKTDKPARLVSITDIKVDKVAYPGVSEKVKGSLSKLIRKYLLKSEISISLDRFLAMMQALDEKKKDRAKISLKNPVPKFILSTKPAVLVFIDGDPVYLKQGGGVSIVGNSDFLIVKDDTTKKIYLKAAGRWFESNDIKKDWKPAESPPKSVVALDKTVDEEKIDSSIPPPEIIISFKPAELIQCDGQPVLGTIPNTDLSYLKNSDSDVFRDEDTSKLYILASGRWFTADKKEGPWSYIESDKLPADFKKIPLDSPKAHVLASIAGTSEARDAVMEASIPQTAILKAGTADLKVVYDGEPKFKPIEGSKLSYAINTNTPIVKHESKYYACVDGAWYVSDSPKGSWSVCTSVPDEIYEIPPSNPLYNTTFVKLYDYDEDDNEVEYGYTPGYAGSFAIGGSLVFGTGWLYRCWRYHHMAHIQPISTYGHGCRYDRYLGCWRRHARYKLANGKYVAWKNKFRGSRMRPAIPMAGGDYIGNRPRHTLPVNAYARNKAAIKTNVLERGQHAKKLAKTQTRMRIAKKRASRLPNNVFVGKDGKIYRHSLNGWQKMNRGKWSGAAKPTTRPTKHQLTRPVKTRPLKRPTTRPTRPIKRPSTHDKKVIRDLKRHYKSRKHGSYRSKKYHSYRRRSSSHRRSSTRRSYRRSGGRRGGRRGGGGRRR